MLKIILIAISSVIFVLLAGFFVQQYLENKIHNKLGKDIFPGHTIRIGGLDVRILGRSISAENIIIVPDTSTAKPSQRFRVDSATIKSLRLGGISALRYLFSENLNINTLELGKTDVQLSLRAKDSASRQQQKEEKTLPLKDVFLKKLKIVDFRMVVLDMENGEQLFSIDKFKMHTNDIVASAEGGSVEVLRYPRVKELLADSLEMRLSDGFYKMKVGKLAHTGKHDFEVLQFALEPQYPQHTFAEKRGYQSDRMDIAMEMMSIKGLDLSRLHENVLACRSITTEGINSDIFRDKRFDRLENHRPPMPEQALRDMKLKLCIDTISMNNNEFRYAEYVPKASQAGFVFFNDLNIQVENLNNDPVFFNRSENIRTTATARIMGESNARVEVHFPVTETGDTLFFSGEMEPVDLAVFNTMVVHNQNVRINKGALDKLSFEAQANNNIAAGRLEFLYHDLDLTVLKKKNGQDKDRKIFSFLMNTFLRSNNPKKNEPPAVAEIKFERDPKKGFMNYLWKSVLDGVKNTATNKRSKWVKENLD